MNKASSKKKDTSASQPEEGVKKTMLLDQVIPLKYVLGWGAGLLVTLMPISYHLGKWMQKIDDKFEVHQKQTELNETRTQLTLEYNDKITKLEKENTRLETLLEVYKGKEVNNGK